MSKRSFKAAMARKHIFLVPTKVINKGTKDEKVIYSYYQK